ncbi:hypothetical protein ACFQE1_10375 [Halobium palmae]|uniref:Uncharacterized protein n=1 Tax=Halobium palmae TaxID=1776492 RepID=A0ABD5RZP9_9EURY
MRPSPIAASTALSTSPGIDSPTSDSAATTKLRRKLTPSVAAAFAVAGVPEGFGALGRALHPEPVGEPVADVPAGGVGVEVDEDDSELRVRLDLTVSVGIGAERSETGTGAPTARRGIGEPDHDVRFCGRVDEGDGEVGGSGPVGAALEVREGVSDLRSDAVGV